MLRIIQIRSVTVRFILTIKNINGYEKKYV